MIEITDTEAPAAASFPLGDWFPVLAVIAAVGLLGIAAADTAARQGSDWSYPLFWAALLTIYVPIALRLVQRGVTRAEGMGLVCLLGLALYLVKVLYSPTGFVLHDEFAHWRTANDILNSGRLFEPNPLIPVSPLYPGLESVTAELASLAGIPVFFAAVAVIGAARLLLMLALWLLYERVTGSARLAGVAALVYAAAPNFLFWSSQFAYESLALPLALVALLALVTARRRLRRHSTSAAIAALLLGAVVVTHHATSFAVAVVLLAWWLVTAYLRGRGRPVVHVVGPLPGLLTLAAAGLWVVLVAPLVLKYLSGPVASSAGQLMAILDGALMPRQLFAAGGHVNPAWERAIAIGTAALLLLAIPLGARAARRLRPRSAFLGVLLLCAALYPLTLPLRFSTNGQEIAGRMLDLVFIGAAPVVALALCRVDPRRFMPHPAFSSLAPVFLAVVFTGGVVVGTGIYARLPGPYLVAAGPRSIEPEGAALASWSRRQLGPNNRMVADRINALQLGSAGEQYTVSGLTDSIGVWLIYFPDHWNPEVTHVLREGHVRYVVTDLRLAGGVPYDGVYFDNGEAPNYNYPINLQALLKFDGLYGTSRIYDSGDIQIYDVSGLLAGSPYGPAQPTGDGGGP